MIGPGLEGRPVGGDSDVQVPPAHLQRGQTALVDRGGDRRGPPRHRRSAQAAPFAYITGDYEMDSQHEVVISQYDVGAGGALSAKSPATVAAGTSPIGVAVSPDGGSVYVANNSSNSVSQYDVGAGGALAPKTPATVTEGGFPRGVAVSPDGGSVYVTNQFGGTSPSMTSARAGRSRPRARPRWPRAPARAGWR